MVNGKRRMLSTLLLMVAGLVAGHPCDAAYVSSSSSGGLASLWQTMDGLETKLVSVKNDLAREFTTLQAIESQIIAGKDLDSVPHKLELSSMRINVMQDELAKISKSAATVGVKLTRIRDHARRRGNDRLARAAEQALAYLVQLKTDIKVTDDGVMFARDTVSRLRDMLGSV